MTEKDLVNAKVRIGRLQNWKIGKLVLPARVILVRRSFYETDQQVVKLAKLKMCIFRKKIHMRTNIDIDEELIREAMKLTGISTKKGVVEKALALMVSLKKQERIKQLRGKFKWEGNLDEMREGRDFG
jgi:Arc/MetJ family transcription regulator